MRNPQVSLHVCLLTVFVDCFLSIKYHSLYNPDTVTVFYMCM